MGKKYLWVRSRLLAGLAGLTLALVAAAPRAIAASYDFHCPAPGTVVEYNSGVTLTFTGRDGFRCTYTDEAGVTVEKYAGFGDDVAMLNAGLDRLWPLSLGAEQILTVPGLSASSTTFGSVTERFTVMTGETISVPAGKFDTVVIEQEEAVSGNNGHNAKRTFWYAPDLGVVIKSTFLSIREPRFAQSTPARILPGDYMAVRISGLTIAPPATVAQPTTPATVQPATLSVDAIANRLHTLKDLLDKKLITPQEYKAKRKAILDSIQPAP